jgi:hypothetical protein
MAPVEAPREVPKPPRAPAGSCRLGIACGNKLQHDLAQEGFYPAGFGVLTALPQIPPTIMNRHVWHCDYTWNQTDHALVLTTFSA